MTFRRAGTQQHSKPPTISYNQLKREKEALTRTQEWIDARRVVAVAAGNLVCKSYDMGQLWRPDRFFAPSRDRWIEHEEATARVEDCKAGVIFDAEAATNRRLNHDEQRLHLIGGALPIIRLYVVTGSAKLVMESPASDCPTEVV